MEMYATPILINGKQQTILVYKSETPMEFSDLGFHRQEQSYGNTNITTTYITEPYIYQEIPPEESDSGPYYFYWFLVNRIDTVTSITNQEEIEALKARLEASESAILGLMQMQLNQPM